MAPGQKLSGRHCHVGGSNVGEDILSAANLRKSEPQQVRRPEVRPTFYNSLSANQVAAVKLGRTQRGAGDSARKSPT